MKNFVLLEALLSFTLFIVGERTFAGPEPKLKIVLPSFRVKIEKGPFMDKYLDLWSMQKGMPDPTEAYFNETGSALALQEQQLKKAKEELEAIQELNEVQPDAWAFENHIGTVVEISSDQKTLKIKGIGIGTFLIESSDPQKQLSYLGSLDANVTNIAGAPIELGDVILVEGKRVPQTKTLKLHPGKEQIILLKAGDNTPRSFMIKNFKHEQKFKLQLMKQLFSKTVNAASHQDAGTLSRNYRELRQLFTLASHTSFTENSWKKVIEYYNQLPDEEKGILTFDSSWDDFVGREGVVLSSLNFQQVLEWLDSLSSGTLNLKLTDSSSQLLDTLRIYYFPSFHVVLNSDQTEKLQRILGRYLDAVIDDMIHLPHQSNLETLPKSGVKLAEMIALSGHFLAPETTTESLYRAAFEHLDSTQEDMLTAIRRDARKSLQDAERKLENMAKLLEENSQGHSDIDRSLYFFAFAKHVERILKDDEGSYYEDLLAGQHLITHKCSYFLHYQKIAPQGVLAAPLGP